MSSDDPMAQQRPGAAYDVEPRKILTLHDPIVGAVLDQVLTGAEHALERLGAVEVQVGRQGGDIVVSASLPGDRPGPADTPRTVR